MKKKMLTALHGFTLGVTLQYTAAIIISQLKHLGYFMACITTLPEMLGGEIRAVGLQALICGLTGTGVALALNRRGARKKCALAFVSVLPALALSVVACRGLN